MNTRTPVLGALIALAVVPSAATAATFHAPKAAGARPRAFASCAALVGYARGHFAVTHGVPEPMIASVSASTPAGYVSTSPAQPSTTAAAPTADTTGAGTSFSTTNDQEAGVDEPDIVKTDGTTIFAVANDTLYAIAVSAATPRLAGSLALGSGGFGATLLLHNSRLIVISGGRPSPVALRTPAVPIQIEPSPYYYPATTTVTEVDVSDPAAMMITRTMTISGAFVDARQNGATARLVISSAPAGIAEPGVRGTAGAWVPTRTFHSMLTGRHYIRPVAACTAIDRPAQFSGLGMLTIMTLDLDKGLWTASTDALMADAQVVYGSDSNLYVATQRWVNPATPLGAVPVDETTQIDQFDATDPQATTFVASGEVPGYLLNQFSLSEYNGFLRVATTSHPVWWDNQTGSTASQSYVTVLRDQGNVLAQVGQVSGLGAGEQIYSVRFVGDAGYVVTFRQVDPLYTIDLSQPSAPRVAGQLELQGYSAYLQPVGAGLLLGIGQNVDQTNEPSGTLLELFDVSDLSMPRLLASTSLDAGSTSEAQVDHHALLFWPATDLAVLPVQIYAPFLLPGAPTPAQPQPSQPQSIDAPFVGAIGYHVGPSGITEVGRITHDPVDGYAPTIRRSLVIGDQLFTVSDAGVMASSLDTLVRQAFVAFPNATPLAGNTSTLTPVPGVPRVSSAAASG